MAKSRRIQRKETNKALANAIRVGTLVKDGTRLRVARDEDAPKSSQKYKSEINNMPTSIPPRYLILTPWMTEENRSRKPQIEKHYKHTRWVDITSAYAWEKDKECPYYGLIIAYDADDVTISQINDDKRYFILGDSQGELNNFVSPRWISELINWFINTNFNSILQ